MPYNTENVLYSEKAYTVLREIALSEDGSYGKKIADDNDMKQQLASEIISNLNELEILVKGKRTRAQYYELTSKGEMYFEETKKARKLRQEAKEIEEKVIEKIKKKSKEV